jgi:hypothetical protein
MALAARQLCLPAGLLECGAPSQDSIAGQVGAKPSSVRAKKNATTKRGVFIISGSAQQQRTGLPLPPP